MPKGIKGFIKGQKFSEEHKKNLSISHKNFFPTEETRKKLSEAGKKRIRTKEYKEAISKGKLNSIKSKLASQNAAKKMGLAQKGKKHSEETKEKKRKNWENKSEIEKLRLKKIWSECHVGEKSYLWKGGISFLPYSSEFNNYLKNKIRERDKYICQNPHCQKSNSKDIHHIDYDKKNSKEYNLITLCRSCHMKTNQHREYWKKYYYDILNNKLENLKNVKSK